MPNLLVEQRGGFITCHEEGATGMCHIGSGKTVAEAVGDFCIFSGLVVVRCEPPELLEQYQAKKVKKFLPIPKRSD